MASRLRSVPGVRLFMNPLASPANWMAVTLTADGLVSSISEDASRLFGGYTGQQVGKPVTMFLSDRSAYEIPRILQIARDAGSWEGEMICRDAEEKEVQVRVAVSSLLSASGQPSGFALIASLMEDAEPNASGAGLSIQVGAKLRDISHQLNNPLAGVMGFTQLIMLDKRCEGPLRTNMEKLYASVQGVLELVDELHSYAVSLQQAPTTKS